MRDRWQIVYSTHIQDDATSSRFMVSSLYHDYDIFVMDILYYLYIKHTAL